MSTRLLTYSSCIFGSLEVLVAAEMGHRTSNLGTIAESYNFLLVQQFMHIHQFLTISSDMHTIVIQKSRIMN